MKRKTPLIFIIPVIAIAGIIAVAFYVRSSSPQPTTANEVQLPHSYSDTSGGKPTTFLGGVRESAGSSATPTVAPSSASDLSNELKTTTDDGGQADLNSIKQESNGL